MMKTWQEWLGKMTSSTTQLTAEPANQMAVTLDREATFQTGDTLPPAWHWLYFHDHVKVADLGPDGHPKLGIVMPPLPLPKRMWAGGTLHFHAPLRLGDQVTKTSTFRAITPKEGRSGPLYFVTLEHRYQVDDAVRLVEEQTIVYRELTSSMAVGQTQAAPTAANYTQIHTLNSTTLFRYSALTFNGHRIHYDVDYCRQVEGYPNLVIHGPLIATLLLDLYCQQGKSPKYFRYRAQSPLFLPHPFTVNGTSTGDSAKLWAANHTGGLAMEAEGS